MHSAVLKQVNGVVMVEVPKDMLDALHVQAGQPVALKVEGGALSLSHPSGSAYRLEDLISQCDFSLPLSPEEQEWIASPPVGRERI